MSDPKPYFVYVIQSQQVRIGKRGKPLAGFHYVGMTTDPKRRHGSTTVRSSGEAATRASIVLGLCERSTDLMLTVPKP